MYSQIVFKIGHRITSAEVIFNTLRGRLEAAGMALDDIFMKSDWYNVFDENGKSVTIH